MKVVILGTAWPYRGGLSAFNERLAREYQSHGHEVEIVTFTLQYGCAQVSTLKDKSPTCSSPSSGCHSWLRHWAP